MRPRRSLAGVPFHSTHPRRPADDIVVYRSVSCSSVPERQRQSTSRSAEDEAKEGSRSRWSAATPSRFRSRPTTASAGRTRGRSPNHASPRRSCWPMCRSDGGRGAIRLRSGRSGRSTPVRRRLAHAGDDRADVVPRALSARPRPAHDLFDARGAAAAAHPAVSESRSGASRRRRRRSRRSKSSTSRPLRSSMRSRARSSRPSSTKKRGSSRTTCAPARAGGIRTRTTSARRRRSGSKRCTRSRADSAIATSTTSKG